MKINAMAAACALAFAGTAMAGTCTSSWSLSSAATASGAWIGDSFSKVGAFTDCYNFSLSSVSDVFGGVMALDTGFNKRDINVGTLSLYSGAALIGSDSDPDPFRFDFSGLAAGSYRLEVAGEVTKAKGRAHTQVGYVGGVVTVAAPVPEPEAYAMVLAGFIGVGGMAWRRRKA